MINIFDINSIKYKAAQYAFNLSEEMIEEYMLLLEQGFCFQIGYSAGKDSTVVLQGALEAMKRSLAKGIILPEHPLVVITVDTLLEPEPIQCYVPFAHDQIREYCAQYNINLKMEIVSPPIYQHLMILFAGAQKLPATASSGRHADCSIIWKVDTGIEALKQIKENLPTEYKKAVWISVSGSRSEESTRRAGNMAKQGVKGVKAQEVISRVNLTEKPQGKVFKFAPISDWITADVMNYLPHAGTESIAKTSTTQKISSFSPNFGLLLAIYGEGSNDVCDVVNIDEKKSEQRGCGGKTARFGCVTCGMTSEDHSTIELKRYARWGRFGDSTHRFRDYIVRIASDVKYRAFHARAYDPATNNNVFLQPNVLKASVLEKLVWYSSQISEDSKKIHLEAVARHKAGEMDNDIGIQDIINDSTLSVSVKKQYKAMYIKRITAGPMFSLFTDEHAVLLSLLWSLHGVATLPYRPVVILDAVQKGKRIPYPLTNAELNAKLAAQGRPAWNDKSTLNNFIPDALVARIFTPVKKSFSSLKSAYGDNLGVEHLQDYMPINMSQYWEDQGIQFDVLGRVMNNLQSISMHTRKFNLTYNFDTRTDAESVKAVDIATGRNIPLDANPILHKKLMEIGRYDFGVWLDNECEKLGLSHEEAHEILADNKNLYSTKRMHEFNHQKNFVSDVVYAGPELREKADAKKNFSGRKRVYDKSSKTHSAGRSSLKVYTPTTVSALEDQASHKVSYWLPDFAIARQCAVDVHDADMLSDSELKQSFVFDPYLYSQWKKMGGWDMLILTHNNELKSRIEKRRPVRLFSGTQPVYHLTNNSGLTTTKHFEQYMAKTLKRTEMFSKAGLFSLAPLSYEKIAEHPLVVDMTTHRSQKVNHLLAMRYIKNQRRTAIKIQIKNHALPLSEHAKTIVSNVNDRITEFASQYEQIAINFVSAKSFVPFSDEAISRAEKIEIWLQEFKPVTNNIESALKVLATKQEALIISNDFDAKQVITSFYEQTFKCVKLRICDSLKTPKDALAKMKNIQKHNIKLVSNTYEADESSEMIINNLSKWIRDNFSRLNVFLLTNGFTACLAYLHSLPYSCGVMGVSENSKKAAKLEERKINATSRLNDMTEALELNNHGVFDDLIELSESDSNVLNHKSVSQLSNDGKSKKLSELMTGNLAAIVKLRKKSA